MLYTREGDSGTTKILNCDQRLSKSAKVAEALGTVDELNSWLGFCKVEIDGSLFVSGRSLGEVLDDFQQDLFIVQAHLAGAPDKVITLDKVEKLEQLVAAIEQELPPIRSFFVVGGTRSSAMLEFGRAISRRAERTVVAVADEKVAVIGKDCLAYLNRLSTVLYALARLANTKAGVIEEAPHY